MPTGKANCKEWRGSRVVHREGTMEALRHGEAEGKRKERAARQDPRCGRARGCNGDKERAEDAGALRSE